MAIHTATLDLRPFASDPEGDPVTLYRVGGFVPETWPYVVDAAPATISFAQNLVATIRYDDSVGADEPEPGAPAELLAEIPVTVWDGQLESAPAVIRFQWRKPALATISVLRQPAMGALVDGDRVDRGFVTPLGSASNGATVGFTGGFSVNGGPVASSRVVAAGESASWSGQLQAAGATAVPVSAPAVAVGAVAPDAVAPAPMSAPTIAPASGDIGTVFAIARGTYSGNPAPTVNGRAYLGGSDVTAQLTAGSGGTLLYTSTAQGTLTWEETATNTAGSAPTQTATASVVDATAPVITATGGSLGPLRSGDRADAGATPPTATVSDGSTPTLTETWTLDGAAIAPDTIVAGGQAVAVTWRFEAPGAAPVEVTASATVALGVTQQVAATYTAPAAGEPYASGFTPGTYVDDTGAGATQTLHLVVNGAEPAVPVTELGTASAGDAIEPYVHARASDGAVTVFALPAVSVPLPVNSRPVAQPKTLTFVVPPAGEVVAGQTYAEKAGVNLLDGATDAEGDALTVGSIGSQTAGDPLSVAGTGYRLDVTRAGVPSLTLTGGNVAGHPSTQGALATLLNTAWRAWDGSSASEPVSLLVRVEAATDSATAPPPPTGTETDAGQTLDWQATIDAYQDAGPTWVIDRATLAAPADFPTGHPLRGKAYGSRTTLPTGTHVWRRQDLVGLGFTVPSGCHVRLYNCPYGEQPGREVGGSQVILVERGGSFRAFGCERRGMGNGSGATRIVRAQPDVSTGIGGLTESHQEFWYGSKDDNSNVCAGGLYDSLIDAPTTAPSTPTIWSSTKSYNVGDRVVQSDLFASHIFVARQSGVLGAPDFTGGPRGNGATNTWWTYVNPHCDPVYVREGAQDFTVDGCCAVSRPDGMSVAFDLGLVTGDSHGGYNNIVRKDNTGGVTVGGGRLYLRRLVSRYLGAGKSSAIQDNRSLAATPRADARHLRIGIRTNAIFISQAGYTFENVATFDGTPQDPISGTTTVTGETSPGIYRRHSGSTFYEVTPVEGQSTRIRFGRGGGLLIRADGTLELFAMDLGATAVRKGAAVEITTGATADSITLFLRDQAQSEATIVRKTASSDGTGGGAATTQPVYSFAFLGQSEPSKIAAQGSSDRTKGPFPPVPSAAKATIVINRHNSDNGAEQTVEITPANVTAGKVPKGAAAVARLWAHAFPGQHLVMTDMTKGGTGPWHLWDGDETDGGVNTRPWAPVPAVIAATEGYLRDNFPTAVPKLDQVVWNWWNQTHSDLARFTDAFSRGLTGQNPDGTGYAFTSGTEKHCFWDLTQTGGKGRGVLDAHTKLTLMYPGPRADPFMDARKNYLYKADGARGGGADWSFSVERGQLSAQPGTAYEGLRRFLGLSRIAPIRGKMGVAPIVTMFGDYHPTNSFDNGDTGIHPAKYHPGGVALFAMHTAMAAIIGRGDAYNPTILGHETSADGLTTTFRVGLPNGGTLSTTKKVKGYIPYDTSGADHLQEDGTGFELRRAGQGWGDMRPIFKATSGQDAAFKGAIAITNSGTGTGSSRYGEVRVTWSQARAAGDRVYYHEAGWFNGQLLGADHYRWPWLHFLIEHIPAFDDGTEWGYPGIPVLPQTEQPEMVLAPGAGYQGSTNNGGLGRVRAAYEAGGGGTGGGSTGGGTTLTSKVTGVTHVATGAGTLDAKVSADGAGKVHAVLLTTSASNPSPSQVRDGRGPLGTLLDASRRGSASLGTGGGTGTIPMAFTTTSDVKIVAVHERADGSLSPVVDSGSFTMPTAAAAPSGDTTPPAVTNARITEASTTSVRLDFDVTEPGTTYVVITNASTQPTKAQIAAGQDHTGSPALGARVRTGTSTGAQSFPIAGAYPAGANVVAHFYVADNASPPNETARIATAGFAVPGGATTPTRFAMTGTQYFKDPSVIGDGTTLLRARFRGVPKNIPSNSSMVNIFSQEAAGFEVEFINGYARLQIEDSAGVNAVTYANGTINGLNPANGTLMDLTVEADFTAKHVRTSFDGGVTWAQTIAMAAGATGSLQGNRRVAFGALHNGTRQLIADVELVEFWRNGVLRKRIEGDAATVSADPWLVNGPVIAPG